MVVRLLAFLLSVLAFSDVALATQASTFAGEVLDPSGTPVSTVTVRLIDAGGNERGRVETDSQGRFLLAAACGGCRIEVRRDGFETASLVADNARPHTITLRLAALQESIVVTATGTETSRAELGVSVSVITAAELERTHPLSTPDLLRAVPGLIASRPGGIGNLASVYVRGGESSYNKVLLDGMPLNEPGGFFDFSAIMPVNIERIEVLRGAHSALFGSDAMSSVIQLFTSRPRAGRRIETSGSVEAGTYETWLATAGAAGLVGMLDYSVQASRLETENRVPNNAHRSTAVSGAAGLTRASGGSLRFVGRGEFGRTGVPGATGFGRADLDAFSERRDGAAMVTWSAATGSRLLHRASYGLTASRQQSSNLHEDPPYTPASAGRMAPFEFSDFLYDSTTTLKRHHGEYRADVTLGARHDLTLALAWDGERGEIVDHMSDAAPVEPRRNNTGVAIQYEGRVGTLSVVSGVRLEHNGSFGSSAAPRGSVAWLARAGTDAIGSTRIRANAGLGVKEPNFIQSFSPNPGFLGNTDLEPEESRGIDAGFEQRFWRDRVRAELTYFANRFQNLISTRTISFNPFRSQYFNIGETRARGAEVAAEAVLPSGFEIRGYYTLLDSEVTRSTSPANPVFQAGQPLFRRPRHSGHLQLSRQVGRSTLSATAVFIGSRVDSDFSLLDPPITSSPARAAWSVAGDARLVRGLAGFVVIDNLLNNDDWDPAGYPVLGRTVRAGVRARF